MSEAHKDRQKRIDSINGVSSSFCLAKWLQVTIDLVHGTNHSCHHPRRHIIPLEELEQNPSALHNTKFKKEKRKQMLAGERPSECEYCWQIEDTEGEENSDRLIKSLDHWAYPHKDRVANLPWDSDIAPTYVEVMFDKGCNLACGYCIADVSSRIEQEIKKFGPYEDLIDHRLPRNEKISDDENNNPYVKAFWKWLPEIVEGLNTLRITGGEPLMSSNTFKVLDYLKENKAKDLTLAVNTNLCVRDAVIDKFIKNLKEVLDKKNIKKFELFTSVDAHREQAEYIREGLDYDQLFRNIKRFKEELGVDVIINCTFGIYSIPKFDNFLNDVYELKQKYSRVILDISYLNHPRYLRANIITPEFEETLKNSLEFMGERVAEFGGDSFSVYEVEKFRRVYHWIMTKVSKGQQNQNRADLYTFITQFDKRYNKDFSKAFPEYNKLMLQCKKSYYFVKKLTVGEEYV
jgi:MoaA/NifB/PqqE/SkfB family radical SAM enzyme